MQDPWSDAALSRTAAMGSARGSTSGDIATIWLNIQRQSQQAAAKSSLTSSPRQDWSNEVAAASPRTGFHGAQQVLFEDVFLDMDKRNEARPPLGITWLFRCLGNLYLPSHICLCWTVPSRSQCHA